MKQILTLFYLILCSSLTAQSFSDTIVLPAGYPVSLELISAFSPAELSVGYIIDMRVRFPVKIGGTTIINEGAYAEGIVTKVEHSRSFGRPASITIQPTYLQTIDDQIIALQGEQGSYKGKSRQGGAIGIPATIAAGGLILATPVGLTAIVIGFFIKGKDVVVEVGTVLKASVLDRVEVLVK